MTVGLGKATNNVAEYRGLIAGLKKALDLGIQRIQAQGDSKLVTQQVRIACDSHVRVFEVRLCYSKVSQFESQTFRGVC